MRGSARLGDRVTGVCKGHNGSPTVNGTIVTGSPDVKANDLPVARIGDKVKLDCGHNAVIVGSSSDVTSNRLHARLGDKVAGDGVDFSGEIVSASPNVIVN
jgi:uncharacterized Zn-binding protein involved in type VI secretion